MLAPRLDHCGATFPFSAAAAAAAFCILRSDGLLRAAYPFDSCIVTREVVMNDYDGVRMGFGGWAGGVLSRSCIE